MNNHLAKPIASPQRNSLITVSQLINHQVTAQLVKNPPAMQETPVRFLDWEDVLEKG